MYRAQSIRIGLGLLAVALVLEYGTGFAQNSLGQGMFVYIILLGALGVSGFAFLVLSTFLPREKRERPTFTQELLGRERVQYGVYTEGNWKSVLDEKNKEEKARRRG